jgi:hypothetical protein
MQRLYHQVEHAEEQHGFDRITYLLEDMIATWSRSTPRQSPTSDPCTVDVNSTHSIHPSPGGSPRNVDHRWTASEPHLGSTSSNTSSVPCTGTSMIVHAHHACRLGVHYFRGVDLPAGEDGLSVEPPRACLGAARSVRRRRCVSTPSTRAASPATSRSGVHAEMGIASTTATATSRRRAIRAPGISLSSRNEPGGHFARRCLTLRHRTVSTGPSMPVHRI